MTRYVLVILRESVYQDRSETEDVEVHKKKVRAAIEAGYTPVAIYTLGQGPGVTILDSDPSYGPLRGQAGANAMAEVSR